MILPTYGKQINMSIRLSTDQTATGTWIAAMAFYLRAQDSKAHDRFEREKRQPRSCFLKEIVRYLEEELPHEPGNQSLEV